MHMYANPDGSVLPCCVADYSKHMGNVQQNTIEEIWNNQKYRDMRLKMLEGKKCDECSGCYAVEEAGNKSTRVAKNKEYKHLLHLADNTNLDGSLDEMTLRHFDVRWSNICNFKCRSCSSTYSSTWAKEDNDQGANKPIHIIAGGNNNDSLYEQFKPHFKQMETFYFAGGEPLLTDKHYDILEYLIEQKRFDVEIRYNSNLSNLVYKGKHVFELWKQFSQIDMFASLDSWGSRAEYIRAGTDWNLIEQNIKSIKKECPHIYMTSSTVISIFNVRTIPQFLDYLFDNGLFDSKSYAPSFYNIINPSYYSFSVMPDNLKQDTILMLNKASTKYNKFIQEKINGVINSLNQSRYDANLNKKFFEVTQNYDSIRNQNFEETFPELEGLRQ